MVTAPPWLREIVGYLFFKKSRYDPVCIVVGGILALYTCLFRRVSPHTTKVALWHHLMGREPLCCLYLRTLTNIKLHSPSSTNACKGRNILRLHSDSVPWSKVKLLIRGRFNILGCGCDTLNSRKKFFSFSKYKTWIAE